MDNNNNILEMRNISKSFPGVKALDDVSIEVKRGEIHALIGENGAGKSTLIKILSGALSRDSGNIFLNNKIIEIHNIVDSINLGISVIYQEYNLISALSVSENIFLGRLSKNQFVNWRDINKKANELMDELNFKIDVLKKVQMLSVAELQMVEIAKALSYKANLIIMDEPSATLTDKEIENFFNVIKSLNKKGITIIYISHRLEEIFKLCNRVTVLRDGKVITTANVAEVDKNFVIEKMVGRKIENEFPQRTYYQNEEIVLEVKNLKINNKIKNINFSLSKKEILGFAGLVGSGRTEVVRALFGADSYQKGEIIVKGKRVKIMSPLHGKKTGIGLLPEDRKLQGVILNSSVRDNITLTNLVKISKGGILRSGREEKLAGDYIKKLDIKTPGSGQAVVNLSGGNQQKVVVAKWLFFDADILIFDEPTRGIDVGAKYEIYLIMKELIDRGKSIILISSEMEEVIALSDRVIVMHNGEIKGILKHGEATPENILQHAIGNKSNGKNHER